MISKHSQISKQRMEGEEWEWHMAVVLSKLPLSLRILLVCYKLSFFWWREEYENNFLPGSHCCFGGKRAQSGSWSMCLMDVHLKRVLHYCAPRRNFVVMLFIVTVFFFLATLVFLPSFSFLWLPPAHAPHFFLSSPSSGDKEQKPNWVQLVVSQGGLPQQLQRFSAWLCASSTRCITAGTLQLSEWTKCPTSSVVLKTYPNSSDSSPHPSLL